MCERITGNKMKTLYENDNRIGDHIWWISDTRKFGAHYPGWRQTYDVEGILLEIFEGVKSQDR